MATAIDSCNNESQWEVCSKEALSPLDKTTTTVYELWSKVFSVATGSIGKLYQVTRSIIGIPIRDCFFFPLALLKLPILKDWNSYWVVQTQKEVEFSRDFWDPEKRLDPNFPFQKQIRAEFISRESSVEVQTESGKTVQMNTHIVESKDTVGKPADYTFVYAPGIFGTIRNQSSCIYPYITAILKEKERRSSRFITLGFNDVQDSSTLQHIRPATIEEGGWMYYQALQKLQKEFGKINEWSACSLGCIFVASALKHFKEEELPKNICFHTGPTSIWEVSKKQLMSLGWLFYPLLKFVGWASNVEKEISDFCQKNHQTTILVSGVKNDIHFPGSANLCLGKEIQKLHDEGRIQLLYFDPPQQLFDKSSHHSLRTDFLNWIYLKTIPSSDFLDELEHWNLAEVTVNRCPPALCQEKTGG